MTPSPNCSVSSRSRSCTTFCTWRSASSVCCWPARTPAPAPILIGGGLIYLGLWLYGLLADLSGPRNILPLNNADNWLHFSIGVVMVLLGLTLAGARVPTGAGGEPLIDPE